MYKVSLVQPNFQTGPKHLNSFYLPYSLGVLWSYANQFSEISEAFVIDEWVFSREPLNKAVNKLKDSDIVLLSVYIWNKNYCFTLAKKLKEVNPNITILAGGPEIPYKEKDFFNKYFFLDSIVVGEGEISFHTFLKDYLSNKQIKNLYDSSRLTDLNIPSPYLTGVFDQLIDQYPDIEWVPTFECDRGCPYQCTFCDWGSLTASKMYKMYKERIVGELEWFGQKGLPYLSMTNSNFGIFKERDLEIAQWIVDTNKKYGVPKGLSVSYAKNSNDTVIEIVKKFNRVNIQSGMSISLQSTNSNVLENIKRTNLKINKINEIVEECNKNSLPVMTELILGLPGETYSSWIDSLNEIFKNKILYVDIFFLQILVNAPISSGDVDKYGLKTFFAYDYFYETTNSRLQKELKEETAESIQVVYETKTLPEKDFFNASVFSWFVTGMHSYGLTNIIADYIFEHNLDTYAGFYLKLLSYIESKDSKIVEWKKELKQGFLDWREKGYMKTKIGETEVLGHAILTNLMPVLQTNNYIKRFIDLTGDFLQEQYNFNTDLLNDFKLLSNLQVKQFDNYLITPIRVELKSNILKSKYVKVEDRFYSFPKTKSEHIDYLFFGRRRMWHLNKITLD